jgi:hypothetical protein
MFFKFHVIVDVEVSIVNTLIPEWCVHSRLFNAYTEVKYKITPDIL